MSARAILSIVLLAVGGCAVVPRGKTERLVVESDPPGARVTINPDGIRCTTPCSVSLQSMLNYVVSIEKQGYATENVRVQAEAGGITTARSKGLRPNPVRVALRRTSPLPAEDSAARIAPASAPAPVLPKPVASLENCIQPSIVDREACLGRLRLGMPRAEVIALLGEPDGESRDGSTLRYGDRYLKLDDDDKLDRISDRPL